MKFKIEKLTEMQTKGIKYLASVVGSCYNTTYYHVVSINAIIENGGKWIPASYSCHIFKDGSYKYIRTGINSPDWSVTELRYKAKG